MGQREREREREREIGAGGRGGGGGEQRGRQTDRQTRSLVVYFYAKLTGMAIEKKRGKECVGIIMSER